MLGYFFGLRDLAMMGYETRLTVLLFLHVLFSFLSYTLPIFKITVS